MEVKFYKYHGVGNDFIIIDDRGGPIKLSPDQVAALCHRRFGIGADGLILLRHAPPYDFLMKYYNSDGREGSMCGNGGRCVVQFALDLGLIHTNATFMASDGAHSAQRVGDEIKLQMQDAPKIELVDGNFFVDTGSPHVVIPIESPLKNYPVVAEGRALRTSSYWTERGGTNVNFVKLIDNGTVEVRTYERGVEDETFSCGTGAVATALTANSLYSMPSPVSMETKGGRLTVYFERRSDATFTNIYLLGPAKRVFTGILEIKEGVLRL
jgi:diaminopimelate epimerase